MQKRARFGRGLFAHFFGKTLFVNCYLAAGASTRCYGTVPCSCGYGAMFFPVVLRHVTARGFVFVCVEFVQFKIELSGTTTRPGFGP